LKKTKTKKGVVKYQNTKVILSKEIQKKDYRITKTYFSIFIVKINRTTP